MGKKAKEKKSNDTKTERAVKKSGAGAVQKTNGTSVESPWLFSDPQDRTGEDRSSMACVSPGNRCFAGGKSHLCSFTESRSSTGMGKYGAFRTCENL